MAEDDSGVIFGNPDAPIPIGFGNPDAPNPIGFGFPTKVAKVRKCATVIRCPGEDFLNYSTECDDVDYAGGTILKCLDQATPIDFFVKAPGIGPWTWDVQNLPDGVMFLVNDFCPSLLNIFGILTSDQTTTTIITVTDGFGNVTVMKITFSTSTVGPCHIVDPTPIICTEEPCPGPGDSFTIELCDGTEQTYTIPADATPEQVLAIQQQAADAFYRSLLTCRLTPPPPSPPPPNLLWYNQSQTWTDTCPDGSFFFYTVGANKYAASTLLAANTKALAAAKKQADKLFICISPDTLPDGVIGTPYSQLLTATEGTSLYTFTLDSGTLPNGLTLIAMGLISGTPTTGGTFAFTVKVTDSSNPQKSATKNYTITVPGTLTIAAYWTLNEALNSDDRVDSVSGIHLSPLGIGAPGAPALYSNGIHFTELLGSADYVTLPPPAALAYNAPDSWSAWGWFKINAFGTGNAFGGPEFSVNLGGNGAPGAFGIFVGDTGNPVALYRGPDSAGIIAIGTGAWYFFHLCYNGSTNKFGYSLNNNPVSYLPSSLILSSSTTGGCGMAFNFTNGGGPGDVLYDEIGIMANNMLTTTQQTYLYNLGVGRTWPIVLPP